MHKFHDMKLTPLTQHTSSLHATKQGVGILSGSMNNIDKKAPIEKAVSTESKKYTCAE